MKLSAPVQRLKRKAKLLSREKRIPHHAALDLVAAQEGAGSWSLLAARSPSPAQDVYARLRPGELLLVAARPGHGKTLFSLELAVQAMRAGHGSTFFTLEYAQKDILDRFRALGLEPARFNELFSFENSDDICAAYVISRLRDARSGDLAVIDYLQLLDQKRDHPPLSVQVGELRRFARERRVTLVFISQIDRSYDPSRKALPDIGDVRLPNPLDLHLFDKACFLHAGEISFGAVE